MLTITRHLNPANLADVKGWYRRQFQLRAYPTQAATVLLLLAALLAGAAAATTLLTSPASTPTLTITQTPSPNRPAASQQATVTLSVTFHGLPPGQPATVIVTTPGPPGALARGAATATPDGTAAATLTTTAGRRPNRHHHRHRPPPHMHGHPQHHRAARSHLPHPLNHPPRPGPARMRNGRYQPCGTASFQLSPV